jgi:hypothetical protein
MLFKYSERVNGAENNQEGLEMASADVYLWGEMQLQRNKIK